MENDFHEIWWIYSPSEEEWGGLRIAHFRKSTNDVLIVIIDGEVDRRRVGLRVWEDIEKRERWYKVAQIIPPTKTNIQAAMGAYISKTPIE